MIILGAGLSGLIAGSLNQNASILEPFDDKPHHQALLRFRSPEIGEAVGIPFKEVKVYKGIWHNDKPVPISPRYIALYSRKVSDTIAYRSITNLDTETRWIAPADFHTRLKEQCRSQISYNFPIDEIKFEVRGEAFISTLPIFYLAEILNQRIKVDKGKVSSIFVNRYKIPACDAYMTYYYTDPTVGCYRASITGDTLIIESMWPIKKPDVKVVSRSFGLTGTEPEWGTEVENFEQPNGKMVPIDETMRRNLILKFTLDYNIYSLGRFAVWRNLVLDDVYKDYLKIKEMMNKDHYHYYKEMNCGS